MCTLSQVGKMLISTCLHIMLEFYRQYINISKKYFPGTESSMLAASNYHIILRDPVQIPKEKCRISSKTARV